MPKKKSNQESVKVTLASVKKEMAEPRMAPSVRMEEEKRQGTARVKKPTERHHQDLAKTFRVSRNSFQRNG
jgi:hypothetical protein